MRGRAMMGRGRRSAVRRMTETVQFFEVKRGLDPETFLEADIEVPVGSPVAGRLRVEDRAAREVVVAGQVPSTSMLVLSVPVDSVLVDKGAFARVIASTSDASLVGTVVRVLFSPTQGQVSAWRYPVEGVSA